MVDKNAPAPQKSAPKPSSAPVAPEDNEILNTAPTNTEEARAQSAEMLKHQESMAPSPSQEELDAIKLRGTGQDPSLYKTRDAGKE